MSDVNGLVGIHDLHNLTASRVKVHLELRMRVDERFNGAGKQLHVGVFREADERRDIVHRGRRLLHAIDIDTDLCVGERNVCNLTGA